MPQNEVVISQLQKRFPSAVIDVPAETIDDTVIVDVDQFREVAKYLRDEAGYDYLTDLTAVDLPEHFEVVYHFYGVCVNQGLLRIKLRCSDKSQPAVPSVVDLWKSADFQEREVWDLMGIRFDGHPNLKRIMMWEGYEEHPLRKDFQNRTFTYEEMEPSRKATEDW